MTYVFKIHKQRQNIKQARKNFSTSHVSQIQMVEKPQLWWEVWDFLVSNARLQVLTLRPRAVAEDVFELHQCRGDGESRFV